MAFINPSLNDLKCIWLCKGISSFHKEAQSLTLIRAVVSQGAPLSLTSSVKVNLMGPAHGFYSSLIYKS